MYASKIIMELYERANILEKQHAYNIKIGEPYNDEGIKRASMQINHRRSIAKDIEKSVKFDFGKLGDLTYFFNNINNSTLFRNGIDSYRLPFKLCWFEYKNCHFLDGKDEIDKYGILIKEQNEKGYVSIIRVVKFKFNKTWSLFDSEYLDIDLIEGKIGKDKGDPFNIMGRRGTEDFSGLFLLKASVMLLCCKNISTKKHYPKNQKLQRKWKKKGKLPLFTYHILIIKPVGNYQKSIPKNLWDNRIHLCRGHFKNFTKDNPLFGKYIGRYWWQPSVRGRNKKGIVAKDYKIEV